MKPDEHDELWEVLGKARRQEPGSFFARNVARQARILGTGAQTQPATIISKLVDWFQANPIALPATAVAVAAFGLLLNLTPTTPLVAASGESSPTLTETAPVSTEIAEFAEELSELDEINELLALQDVSSIDDDAIALLLF